VKAANLDKINSRFAGSLMPGGTLGAGFTIIDASQLEILAPLVAGRDIEVVARVVVYGDVEGDTVESKPFDYPVTICNGCLVTSLGECSSLPSDVTGQADEGALCTPGNNGRVQCCNSGGFATCPAQGTAAPL
jgi:hypothetical protein